MSNTHHFPSPEKEGWRERSLVFYIKPSPLLNQDHKFVGPVLETFGTMGLRSHTLLLPYLTSSGVFFGAEDDIATFIRVALELSRLEPDQRPSLIRNDIFEAARLIEAAIVNYDLPNQVGSSKWWDKYGRFVKDTAQNSVTRYGSHIIVINHTLDTMDGDTQGTAVDRLYRQANGLCQVFRPWGLTRERLLGTDPKALLVANDRAFKRGYIGAFDIYKGSNNKLRMATVRLRFDAVAGRCPRIIVDEGK